MTIIINFLSEYFLTIITFIVTILLVYITIQLFRERMKGKKFIELKKPAILFIVCLAVLWFINIYIGYIQ